MTKEEWDDYAHKNNLFSAFTLEAHLVDALTWEKLTKENKSVYDHMVKKLMRNVIKNEEKKGNGKFIKGNK